MTFLETEGEGAVELASPLPLPSTPHPLPAHQYLSKHLELRPWYGRLQSLQLPSEPDLFGSLFFQNNHLLLPFKKTTPLPSLPGALRTYISEHFKTISPEAFKDDIHQFVRLRRDAVEGGIENHRENIGRLIK